MTEKELRKLSRIELLELMLKMSRDMEKQKKVLEEKEKELEDLREQLSHREIILNQSGSIAEAAVKLNGLFQTAQDTVEEYLVNVQAMVDRKKAKLRAERKAIVHERRQLEADKEAFRQQQEQSQPEQPGQEQPENSPPVFSSGGQEGGV